MSLHLGLHHVLTTSYVCFTSHVVLHFRILKYQKLMIFCCVFSFIYVLMRNMGGKPDTTNVCWISFSLKWEYFDVIQEKIFHTARLGYSSLMGAPRFYGIRRVRTGRVMMRS